MSMLLILILMGSLDNIGCRRRQHWNILQHYKPNQHGRGHFIQYRWYWWV